MEKTNKPIIDYQTDFLEYLDIEKGLGNNSQLTYQRLINKFFSWLKENRLKNLKPHELTKEHVWKYRVSLSKKLNKNTNKPLTRNTQNRYLIALRNLLKFFVLRDILSLPAEKIKLAKQPDTKIIKFLKLGQIKDLLEAPKTNTLTGLRDKAILEALFSTGMRVAELTNLDRNQLSIKYDTKDLEISIVGKGKRVRPVYLSERCLYWLKKYLKAREDKEKPLFIRYKGPKNAPSRLTTRSIESIVKKIDTIGSENRKGNKPPGITDEWYNKVCKSCDKLSSTGCTERVTEKFPGKCDPILHYERKKQKS